MFGGDRKLWLRAGVDRGWDEEELARQQQLAIEAADRLGA